MYQQVALGHRVARFAGTAANQGTFRDVSEVGDSQQKVHRPDAQTVTGVSLSTD